MALNVKPLWGAHYPFCHPEVTYPDKESSIDPGSEEEHTYGDKLKRHQKLLQRVKRITALGKEDKESEERRKNLILLDAW